MKCDFEDFLKEEHMKNYHGFDDNAPDAYQFWLDNMNLELLIAYGDKFGALKAYNAVKEFGEKLNLK